MPRLVVDTSKKYGLLRPAQEDIRPSSDGHKYWLCDCDCGEIVRVRASDLVHGRRTSCGCVRKQRAPGEFIQDTAPETPDISVPINIVVEEPKKLKQLRLLREVLTKTLNLISALRETVSAMQRHGFVNPLLRQYEDALEIRDRLCDKITELRDGDKNSN